MRSHLGKPKLTHGVFRDVLEPVISNTHPDFVVPWPYYDSAHSPLSARSSQLGDTVCPVYSSDPKHLVPWCQYYNNRRLGN